MREIGDGKIEIIDDEDEQSGEVYLIEEAEVYEIEESQPVYEIDESEDVPLMPFLGGVLEIKSAELHDSKAHKEDDNKAHEEDDSKHDADLQAALAASLATLQHHASGVQVCCRMLPYAAVCCRMLPYAAVC
jgi:hypothetical protein